jgi:hypothetical protein
MKTRCLAFLALLGAALTTDNSIAAIIQDFQFSESGAITGAVNSASPGNNFQAQSSSAEYAMNGAGVFRIVKATPTTQVGNTFDIANVTTGKVWLVVDIAGWNYTATASSPAERVRFGFLDNNDPVAAGSSTISAEMTIDRLGDNSIVLSGEALGTGSANISTDLTLGLSRSTNFRMVLELDKTADTYSVYYKDGAAPYGLLGSAPLGDSTLNTGKRDGNSVRFAFTGLYSDTGEFFDVDRIYVTDENPIPEPAGMLLVCVAATLGMMLRRRAA